jgi:hypothetical protein
MSSSSREDPKGWLAACLQSASHHRHLETTSLCHLVLFNVLPEGHSCLPDLAASSITSSRGCEIPLACWGLMLSLSASPSLLKVGQGASIASGLCRGGPHGSSSAVQQSSNASPGDLQCGAPVLQFHQQSLCGILGHCYGIHF